MPVEESIANALILLEGATENPADSPAVVILPPYSGDFIIGNRDGFVRLAIASLKAAQGREQPFKKEPWVVVEDLNWGLSGFKPDPSAHIYLPSKHTFLQKLWRRMFAILFLVLGLVCLVLGAIVLTRWLFSLS